MLCVCVWLLLLLLLRFKRVCEGKKILSDKVLLQTSNFAYDNYNMLANLFIRLLDVLHWALKLVFVCFFVFVIYQKNFASIVLKLWHDDTSNRYFSFPWFGIKKCSRTSNINTEIWVNGTKEKPELAWRIKFSSCVSFCKTGKISKTWSGFLMKIAICRTVNSSSVLTNSLGNVY